MLTEAIGALIAYNIYVDHHNQEIVQISLPFNANYGDNYGTAAGGAAGSTPAAGGPPAGAPMQFTGPSRPVPGSLQQPAPSVQPFAGKPHKLEDNSP